MSAPTLTVSEIFKDKHYASWPLHFCVAIGNLGTLQYLLDKATPDAINESDDKWGTPLHISIYLDNEDAVDMLLKAGARPARMPDYVYEEYHTTPIGVAARLGNMNLLWKLWQHVDFETVGIESCLVEAAGYSQPSTVDAILGWGRERWSLEVEGHALSEAAKRWNIENIRFLLSRCSFVQESLDSALGQVPATIRFKKRQTDSVRAAQSQTIKLLMDAGADPCNSKAFVRSSMIRDEPLLVHTIAYEDLHNCLEAMLENGTDPNVSINAQGQTLLHYVAIAARGRIMFRPRLTLPLQDPSEAACKLLFRFNASVLQQDMFGNTPLHFAAATSNLYFLQYMLSSLPTELERKATLRLRNHQGESLLHFASGGAQISIMEYLLSDEVGLRVDETTFRGWTPLLNALAPSSTITGSSKLEAARLLLARGADPTVVTHDGWTALHCLAINSRLPQPGESENLVGELLSRGVLLDSRASFAFDEHDQSRQVRSKQGILYGCLQLHHLEDPKLYGKAIRSGLTPLHVAALHGTIDVVRALLKRGADPAAEDSKGNSPARLAGDSKEFCYYKDQEDMISLLLEAGGSY
ncbi:ankyrin repeat-containing domain protein [Fusarium flagelliforme]|uniref:ankyrin repeat-containing domain protein n=1 Tax=Fusarium flagelliforme TaxID=2675880 RepID=UPI001E8E2751|nr:ankyrin repeat-containing domain protein [Fusarium flagelliforme]KAH7197302.1 ankyrin repeat-containing domain protein [Fusarium flagelliforme]